MELSRRFNKSEWVLENSLFHVGYRNTVDGQWLSIHEYNRMNYRLIRICPLENGQFKAHMWDQHDEEYHEIEPEIACQLLAESDTEVEIAVPDLKDSNSHYESNPSRMEKI